MEGRFRKELQKFQTSLNDFLKETKNFRIELEGRRDSSDSRANGKTTFLLGRLKEIDASLQKPWWELASLSVVMSQEPLTSTTSRDAGTSTHKGRSSRDADVPVSKGTNTGSRVTEATVGNGNGMSSREAPEASLGNGMRSSNAEIPLRKERNTRSRVTEAPVGTGMRSSRDAVAPTSKGVRKKTAVPKVPIGKGKGARTKKSRRRIMSTSTSEDSVSDEYLPRKTTDPKKVPKRKGMRTTRNLRRRISIPTSEDSVSEESLPMPITDPEVIYVQPQQNVDALFFCETSCGEGDDEREIVVQEEDMGGHDGDSDIEVLEIVQPNKNSQRQASSSKKSSQSSLSARATEAFLSFKYSYRQNIFKYKCPIVKCPRRFPSHDSMMNHKKKEH